MPQQIVRPVKSGGETAARPPASDTEDLWEDDVKIRQRGYLTDLLGNRAVDLVDTFAKSGGPFLVSRHFNAPHWPWEAPGDEAERSA